MNMKPSSSSSQKVPWNLEGARFDHVTHALFGELLGVSRTHAKEAIENGLITLNGQIVSPRFRVSKGDKVSFTPSFLNELGQSAPKIFPENQKPCIVQTQKDFLAVYKPAGWLSQATESRSQEGNLEDWLVQEFPELQGVPLNGRVHRLDRNTSGLILYARNKATQDILKSLFQERRVKKRYVALVEGHLQELEGQIDKAITRKKGSFKRLIAKIGQKSKEASTDYKVIARLKDTDLLLVLPKTGRTHQIRVHLQSLGHPIAGDTLYGAKESTKERTWTRHFLHAWSLSFPYQEEKITLYCPLPKDLQKALSPLDEASLKSYDDEALIALGLKQ